MSGLLAASEVQNLKACLIELCESGLLTCTNGQPGSSNATYALAWFPLDGPENFPRHIQKRHAENLRRWLQEK